MAPWPRGGRAGSSWLTWLPTGPLLASPIPLRVAQVIAGRPDPRTLRTAAPGQAEEQQQGRQGGAPASPSHTASCTAGSRRGHPPAGTTCSEVAAHRGCAHVHRMAQRSKFKFQSGGAAVKQMLAQLRAAAIAREERPGPTDIPNSAHPSLLPCRCSSYVGKASASAAPTGGPNSHPTTRPVGAVDGIGPRPAASLSTHHRPTILRLASDGRRGGDIALGQRRMADKPGSCRRGQRRRCAPRRQGGWRGLEAGGGGGGTPTAVGRRYGASHRLAPLVFGHPTSPTTCVLLTTPPHCRGWTGGG